MAFLAFQYLSNFELFVFFFHPIVFVNPPQAILVCTYRPTLDHSGIQDAEIFLPCLSLSEGGSCGQTLAGGSYGSNVYKLSDQRGHSTGSPCQPSDISEDEKSRDLWAPNSSWRHYQTDR